MSEQKRADLTRLGRDLLGDGLVVRTWGNFSLRDGGNDFLITPSGRRYDTMQPADLALVTSDGEWRGPLKPSSEHPMHAVVYQQFPQAGCVLHTHQRYASAISLSEDDLALAPDAAALLGQDVLPIAPYGLPSTHRLHRNVQRTLAETGAKVILLRAHGALIWASDATEARELGNALETVAEQIYRDRVGTFGSPGRRLVHSERVSGGFRWFCGPDEVAPDAATHHNHLRIYRKRPDVGAVITNDDTEVQAFHGRRLLPYLDDFAQLVGVRADASLASNVVLTDDSAYCLGSDLAAARDVALVLEKNSRAARIAEVAGTRPIAGWECVLMNQIYRRKYSRQAG